MSEPHRHDASWNDVLGKYLCACGVEICTDCGCRPMHVDSSNGKCRQCDSRGGHRYSFVSEIDHDKLREKLGPLLAADVLRDCKAD